MPRSSFTHLGAVLLVGVDDHLGVAASGEPVAEPLEPLPQLPEVVDLAVERDPDRPVLVAHRLVAAGQIQDGEPALAQRHGPVDVVALVVRPAVAQGVAEPTQCLDRDRPDRKSTIPESRTLVMLPL